MITPIVKENASGISLAKIKNFCQGIRNA